MGFFDRTVLRRVGVAMNGASNPLAVEELNRHAATVGDTASLLALSGFNSNSDPAHYSLALDPIA